MKQISKAYRLIIAVIRLDLFQEVCDAVMFQVEHELPMSTFHGRLMNIIKYVDPDLHDKIWRAYPSQKRGK